MKIVLFLISFYTLLFSNISIDQAMYDKEIKNNNCQKVYSEVIEILNKNKLSRNERIVLLGYKIKSKIECDNFLDEEEISETQILLSNLRGLETEIDGNDIEYKKLNNLLKSILESQSNIAYENFKKFISSTGGDFILLFIGILAGVLFAINFRDCDKYEDLYQFIEFLKTKGEDDTTLKKHKKNIHKLNPCGGFYLWIKPLIVALLIEIIIFVILNKFFSSYLYDFEIENYLIWLIAIVILLPLTLIIKAITLLKKSKMRSFDFYLKILEERGMDRNIDSVRIAHLADLLQNMIIKGDMVVLRKAVYILESSDDSTFKSTTEDDSDIKTLLYKIISSEHKRLILKIFIQVKKELGEEVESLEHYLDEMDRSDE